MSNKYLTVLFESSAISHIFNKVLSGPPQIPNLNHMKCSTLNISTGFWSLGTAEVPTCA